MECEEGEIYDFDFNFDDFDSIVAVSLFLFLLCLVSIKQTFVMIIIALLNKNSAQAIIDHESTAAGFKVAHFDCSKMDSNRIFSLNKVGNCDIKPEKMQVSMARIIIWQKMYRSKLNATMCKASHQTLEWYCGTFDASGMSATQPTITSDIKLSAEQCEHARKFGSVKLNGDDIKFLLNVKYTQYTNKGKVDTKYRNQCDDEGFITHRTYETHMQDIDLNLDLRDGTVNNLQNIPLPCSVSEGGCESTSTDPYAYTWQNQDNCQSFEISEHFAKMVKINDKYYLIRDSDNEHDRKIHFEKNSFVLQIYNKPQALCSNTEIVYPTPYDSLFVSYTGGFDMKTGLSVQLEPNAIKHSYKNDIFTEKYGHNYQDGIAKKTAYSNGIMKNSSTNFVNYEAHLGTKLDFIEFNSIQRLQLNDLQMLKNDCELERSIMQSNLAYSHDSPRMAGFLLTNNRSMFLETNGNIAWLYHCPPLFSDLQVMDKCYDRIPILFKGKIHYVDPITRQTFTNAKEQSCLDKHLNLFQLDIDDDDSWVQLTPSIQQVPAPEIFNPRLSSKLLHNFKFKGSNKVSIYTKKQLREFWRNIEMNAEMKDTIKTFTKELVVEQGGSSKNYYSNYYPINKIYLDSFISPNFFRNKYVKMFGHVQYILERCGIYFAAFLFIKLIIDIISAIYSSMQLHKITEGSVGLLKVIVSATFGIIFASILTSIFNPDNGNYFNPPKKEEPEDAEHLVQSNQTSSEKEKAIQLYPSVYAEINKNHCHIDNDNGDQPTSPI